MEAKIVNPPSQQNQVDEDASPSSEVSAPLAQDAASASPATPTEAPEKLKEALEKIRELNQQEQAAKWGQGDQVNRVEDGQLAQSKGYKHARECLQKELPDLQTSTLSSYAYVARHFTQEHTKRWGVAKLQKLIALQKKGPGLESLGDPAEIEVHVPGADSSLVAKKFSDCTMADLRSAARHRKQTRKAAGRVIRDVSSTAGDVRKLPLTVLWRPLAMIGAGVLAGFIGDWLEPSAPGWAISVLGLLLFMGGLADVIRHFASIRDRIIAAFKSGAALSALKDQGQKVLRNGRKLFAILRSVRRKPAATSSPEETPPSASEKKAA